MLRIWRATVNTRNGLAFAIRSEQAVREEIFALALAVPLAWLVGATAMRRFELVAAVAFVLDGVLIGAGDLRFLAWAMAFSAGALVVTTLPILPLSLGIGWVWAALGVLMATRCVFLLVRYRGDEWAVVGATRAVRGARAGVA